MYVVQRKKMCGIFDQNKLKKTKGRYKRKFDFINIIEKHIAQHFV